MGFISAREMRVPDRLATYVTRLRSARPDLGPEALACPRLASRAFPQPLRLLSQLALDSISHRLGIVAAWLGLPEAGFRPGAGGSLSWVTVSFAPLSLGLLDQRVVLAAHGVPISTAPPDIIFCWYDCITGCIFIMTAWAVTGS